MEPSKVLDEQITVEHLENSKEECPDFQLNNISNVENVNEVTGSQVQSQSQTAYRLRKLRNLLRNEENKLTLMKKIRQSQLKENIAQSSGSASGAANLSGSVGTKAPTSSHNNAPANSFSVPDKGLPQAHLNIPTILPGHHLSAHQTQSIHHHRFTPPAHSHPHHHQTPPAHSHYHSTSLMAAHQQAHVQSPLVRAHQSSSSTILNPPITSNRSVNSYGARPPPPLGLSSHRTNVLPSPGIHKPPASHHQSLLRPGYNSHNRTPVTTPPNVVLNYPVQDLRAQQSLSHQSNQVKPVRQSDIQVSNNACASPLANEINQTPAQRLAAAKAALKKQLEKTLLQIVPPKPPPSEMHFIPNANNNEFIYYYGLETIVDFLTGTDQNKAPPEPFECVQCGTDFTPLWKWQDGINSKRGKPAVICESCVSFNLKKKYRDEHTKRLKSAFHKALQQEQEIERKISSGAPSPPVPALTPPINSNNNNSHVAGLSNPLGNSVHGFGNSMLPQAPPAHSSLSRHGSASATASAANLSAAAALAASSALFNLPKLNPAQQSIFQAQLQQLAQSVSQIQNPQALSQPQPAHMLPFGPLLYQYSALMNSKSGAGVIPNDVHRQYLLDMIPPRSLGQNSGLNWKT